MRFQYLLSVLFLLIALPTCGFGQDKTLDVAPRQDTPPTKATSPMASFARLLPGEWRVTAQSGTSMLHTWHWGPDQRSIRRMTDGSGADGKPWRELRVAYWHPGRKQIQFLGLAPYQSTVMEGSFKFEGDAGEGLLDLHQTGVLRKLQLKWAFSGPDKFTEALFESSGSRGYQLLAEWENVRSRTISARPPQAIEKTAKLSNNLKVLEPFLGRTWEANGAWAAGDRFHTQSTVEWIPLAEGIYIRVLAPSKESKPRHLLDAYVYHHTGTGLLRCLALSAGCGVYEGNLTPLAGGALQLDLKGSEGERVVNYLGRIESENDGSLRQRVWLQNGGEPKLLLDVQHKHSK